MDDGTLRSALRSLVAGEDLDAATAGRVMDLMMEGRAGLAEMAGILVALRLKGETAAEVLGMVRSMRSHATAVELPLAAVDTCGTGGDGTGTFNISTAAALVVAGAGCPVAKHGNRSASSRCGSADVLEELGVTVSLPPEGVRRCVVEAGIGFMFAPAFHPAMRHVAPVRQQLGIPTIFNILGPLANPAGVARQVIGTPHIRLVAVMAEVLQQLGHQHALVLSGPDGLDEIGLSGITHGWEVSSGGIAEFSLDPSTLGFEPAPISALAGGDPAANAGHVRRVLEGDPGPRGEVTVLNAAVALLVGGRASALPEAVSLARESISSGEAGRRLELLVRISREEART